MSTVMKNLPDSVHQYLKDHIPNGHIEELENIRAGRDRHYLLYVETDETLYQLEFDREGQLVRKSTKKRFDTEYTYEDFFDD